MAFWTSLIGKDSWIFFFLGWATYAVAHLLKEIRPRYVLGLITSISFITVIRPHIGAALVGAMCACLVLWLRCRLPAKGAAAILRPAAYILLSVVIAGAGAFTIAISPLFKTEAFSKDSSFAEAAVAFAVERHKDISADTNAPGSSQAVQIQGATVFEVTKFLPGAMFTFLFRPLPFEAHNALALVASFDGTLLLMLVLLRWRHLRAAVWAVLSSPFLGFCSVAFLVLTAGLAFESNFGLIVRHRSMVLPFLFILLAVPLSKRGFTAAAPSLRPSSPLPSAQVAGRGG